MNINELKQVLRDIVKNKAKFKVTGYKSSSTESVHDFELQYVGAGLYKDLIVESLDYIKEDRDGVLSTPEGVAKEDWLVAVEEQTQSFKTSLQKMETPDSEQKETQVLYVESAEGYLVSNKEPDTFAIRNCYMLNNRKIEGGAEKTAKGVKTQLKNMLKSKLPISKYTAMLKFSADKVQSIELV
jgi:hypothetical protein